MFSEKGVGGSVSTCTLKKKKPTSLYLQIYYSGFLSTVYSLLMIVLLIGLIIEAKQSDFCSISTFFFAFVVGVFCFSALLHPTVKTSGFKFLALQN